MKYLLILSCLGSVALAFENKNFAHSNRAYPLKQRLDNIQAKIGNGKTYNV